MIDAATKPSTRRRDSTSSGRATYIAAMGLVSNSRRYASYPQRLSPVSSSISTTSTKSISRREVTSNRISPPRGPHPTDTPELEIDLGLRWPHVTWFQLSGVALRCFPTRREARKLGGQEWRRRSELPSASHR